MNFLRKWSLVAVACSALLVSCSDSNDPDPNILPENKYPVQIKASVEQLNGSSATQSWNGSEKITVQSVAVESGKTPDWNASETLNFNVADGLLSGEKTWYWKTKTESRHFRAWHLANGSVAAVCPDKWSVEADQKAGTASSDFLYASAVAAYGSEANLPFYHQTSKIAVNLKLAGTAASSVTVSSIVIGDRNLALSGDFIAPENGHPAGAWSVGTADSSVIPFALQAPQGYASCVEAMMIPQDVQGKTLLTVTLSDGSEYKWNAHDLSVLRPATAYTLEATVNHDLRTIDVKVVTGATWGDGENVNISSKEEELYGVAKIGDYYYSDGSWSDGGFLGFNKSGNGSIDWASPKPAPVDVNPVTGKKRTVVGIVFCTDLSRVGDAEKAAITAKGGTPHGLVMGLKLIADTQWDNSSHDERQIGIPYITGAVGDPLYKYANADISGYNVCTAVMEKRAADVEAGKYTALVDVARLNSLESGVKSTGWFIPATGQWFDLFRNLTGMDFTDKSDFYTVSNSYEKEDGTHFDWQLDRLIPLIEKYPENITNILNFSMSSVPAALKDNFPSEAGYITTTFNNDQFFYYIGMQAGKFVTVRKVNKSYWYFVRPILAF